jgi:hypothetical protein
LTRSFPQLKQRFRKVWRTFSADEALKRLADHDQRKSEIVGLLFFGGLTRSTRLEPAIDEWLDLLTAH